MTPEEIEAVVRKLTHGEVCALLAHTPHRLRGSASHGWRESAHDSASFCKAGRSLMDRGLIKWPPSVNDSRTLLTDLGLAVRSHLLTMEDERRG